MIPDLSVVIPVFNRGELVRHTLASVRAASAGLALEIVAVDDGSATPLADDLARLGLAVDRLIRQENRGLLFARLAGLGAATGRRVLFLDSDDFVSENKLRAQVRALDATGADVAYTDHAPVVIGPDGPGAPGTISVHPDTDDPAEFFLRVQPPPHSPIFDTGYLRRRVADAIFPPSPLYNPVAEIWFYHVCAPFPARVVKCEGLALVGAHGEGRLTNHWERLAVASLAVMEAFARHCPVTPETAAARTKVAETAFLSWRRLPRDFSPHFAARHLDVWRRLSPRPAIRRLGGPAFQAASAILGAERAGRLFRRRNADYASCRTLDDTSLARMLAQLPPP